MSHFKAKMGDSPDKLRGAVGEVHPRVTLTLNLTLTLNPTLNPILNLTLNPTLTLTLTLNHNPRVNFSDSAKLRHLRSDADSAEQATE